MMALDAEEKALAAMLAKYESLTEKQQDYFKELVLQKQPAAWAICDAHDQGFEWTGEFLVELDRMRSALAAKRKKK